MFNPMQSQAAIQNPARFPDQKLQQYAAGKPPQPTGQVTPPMAGQELAQRGADRQAFQNQAAMQNNPKNSPTIYQELMMKEQMVNQQAQALGQKEQQLGMAGAMLAKKARDIAERERGIAALPVRPDMFTAMDGGIVFSGGGGVKGYSGVDGQSTVGASGMNPNDLMALILKKVESVDEAEKTSMLSPKEKELMRVENAQTMQTEYDEYARGRGERQQKMAAALRGTAPDLGDYLGAMAAGGPGKTLAETISRMVPGALKLRTEQQARDMAAAKFLAEAEEKEAQADLAEKRGQRDVADKLIRSAQNDRIKAFEVTKGAADTGIRALASMQEAQDRRASETARRKEAAERHALEVRKYEEAPSRDEAKLRLEANLKSALIREEAKARRENREPEFREKLFNIANDSADPRNAMAKELLSERRGGADPRMSLDQITDNAMKRYKLAVELGEAEAQIKAAAKDPKNPRALTMKDVYDKIFDEEYEKAKLFYGAEPLKGMGGKTKPSGATTAPWDRQYSTQNTSSDFN